MSNAEKGKPKRVPKSQAVPVAKGSPVCIAALFCDSAIVGEDQTVTIIRTMDTILFGPETEFKLGQLIELPSPNRLVIMLKRNDAIGRHELPLISTAPSGETDMLGLLVQDFSASDGPDIGYNLVTPIRFVWRGKGLYWIELKSKAKKVITRTSLRLDIPSKQEKK